MNYNFDLERIKNQLKYIETLPDSQDKQFDLMVLECILGIGTDKIDMVCSSECLDVWDRLRYVIELFNKIAPPQYESLMNENYEVDNITKKEMLQIIHDFFRTRKDSIYEHFQKVFSNKNTNLKLESSPDPDDAPGYTYAIETIKESYIYCEYTGTVRDIISLAHEFGHATMFLYKNNLFRNPNNVIYRELDGIYFENEMCDYLLENNICSRDVILTLLLEENYMSECAELLLRRFKIDDLYYLLSFIITIELRKRSNKDKLLEKIVTHRVKSPLKALSFINRNMILNNHVEEYHNKLVKRAKDYNLL